MGELTATTFVSLDGVMQAPGAPREDTSGDFRHGGWVFPLAEADMGAIMVEIFSRASAFLLGRVTYDLFAAHWPRVTDKRDPIASRLNALPKHVATRTRAALDWQESSVVRDVLDEVPTLKARYAHELQVHGSAGLLQTLIAHDLIDEYRILVFPVVIGTGKRLFGSGAMPANFELREHRTTSAGVFYGTYRRNGALRTGSFALDD